VGYGFELRFVQAPDEIGIDRIVGGFFSFEGKSLHEWDRVTVPFWQVEKIRF
jgi:hypothetical protein